MGFGRGFGVLAIIGGLWSGMLWGPSIAIAAPEKAALCQSQTDRSSSIDSLIRALNEEDYRIRRDIAQRLRTYGEQACPAVPQLIELLKDWHPDVVVAGSVQNFVLDQAVNRIITWFERAFTPKSDRSPHFLHEPRLRVLTSVQ